MITFATATQPQRVAIRAAFNAAFDVAAHAQALYAELAKDTTLDPADEHNYVAAAEEAQRDLDLLQAKYAAYRQDSPLGQVSPPDAATIAAVQAITTELAAIIVAGNDAVDVLQLLTKTLNIIATL